MESKRGIGKKDMKTEKRQADSERERQREKDKERKR